jgi:AcrR family transcriptional regulator
MARKVGLDRRAVVDAAAAVADDEGLESLSLARVATALGVSSPSLYSHVAGLAALRHELALEAARQLQEAVREGRAGRVGPDALTGVAHAYRQFARQHPGLYATLHTTPSSGEDPEVHAAFAAVVTEVAAALAAIGVSAADPVTLVRTVRSALHGFVSLEASGGFGLPDDVGASFQVLLNVLAAGLLSRADVTRT